MNYLNEAEFDSLIASKDKVLVSFGAVWCGPCTSMTPLLEEYNQKNPGKIAKINVDELPDLTSKFGIRNIPTNLVFQEGQMIERKVGAFKTETEINELLN